MFKLKIGVVLAAVVAVFAISAAPSMAFKEFVAKNTGQLKDTGQKQKFVTNAGTVECEFEVSEGTVKELKSPQSKETVKYGGCKFLNLTATITPAEYDFNASGTVSIANTITVSVSGCSVTVGPGSNQNLAGITYAANTSGQTKRIEVTAEVESITYTTSGGICGAGGKNGKYKGTAIAGLEGGNLEVM